LDGICKNGVILKILKTSIGLLKLKYEGNKGLNGGMMQRQTPQHTVTNYITISSIDEYSSKMEQSGGKMIVPKTKVSGMGFIAVFLDSEQNMFGIFEKDEF
jgi:uncharacterized protein